MTILSHMVNSYGFHSKVAVLIFPMEVQYCVQPMTLVTLFLFTKLFEETAAQRKEVSLPKVPVRSSRAQTGL